MTRRTVIRFFVSAGVFILLYCLWCLRPLAWGPQLVFPESVPPDARRMIEDRYPRPSIGFGEAMSLLRHPVRGRDRVKFTHWAKPDGRHHSVHVPYVFAYEFEEKHGVWSFVGEAPILSIH